MSTRQKAEAEVLQHGTGDMFAGESGTHDAVRKRGCVWRTCRIHQGWPGLQLHDGQCRGVFRSHTRAEFDQFHMHIQQPKYHQHGQASTENT